MSVAERLSAYPGADLAPEAIERAVQAEEMQRHLSHRKFVSEMGCVPSRTRSADRPIEVIDSMPLAKDGRDPSDALIVRLPMGARIDEQMAYQVATIRAAVPDIRLIAFGNTSLPAWRDRAAVRCGTVATRDLAAVAGGDFVPLSRPGLVYAQSHGVTAINGYGASLGAEILAVDTKMAPNYDIDVKKGVFVEPIRLAEQSLRGLVSRFLASGKELDNYAENSQSVGFHAARVAANRPAIWTAGLARPTNVATSFGLRQDNFTGMLAGGMIFNPKMQAELVFAGQSEMCDPSDVAATLHALRDAFGDRVNGRVVADQTHAFVNDIHFQAALASQAAA